MSILRIRDASGNFVAIPSIRGDKGEKGDAGSVTAVNGIAPNGSGNVTLGAADVGARPSNWMPTAADVGALAADGTAADSGRLGGKAPEYYLQTRNLLDNSDFTNPVNQRRQTEITGDWNYGIDRWLVSTTHEQNPNGSILITDNGLSMGYWTDMMQLIPFEQLKSKTLTFAVCAENGVYAYTMTLPESVPPAGSGGMYFGDGIWNDIIVMETIKYDNSDSVMFRFRNAQTTNQLVYWAALYEGSYTADTLPPYVPKGYGAELLECQRYYRELVVLWGTEMGAPTRQKINYSPRMRIEHPTATFAIDTGASASDASMTINGVDWERLDVTGTSYGQATITLNAEL